MRFTNRCEDGYVVAHGWVVWNAGRSKNIGTVFHLCGLEYAELIDDSMRTI